MIKLPDVTLICVDCIDVDRAVNVMEKSMSGIEYGSVKLLTSKQEGIKNIPKGFPHEIIPHLSSLTAYSVFMLTSLYKYIDTKNALVIQHDGYVINPESWEDEFLEYDYIAPLFDDHDMMGCGGFTMRTRSLMGEVANYVPEWDGTQEDADAIQNGASAGFYEDGLIAIKFRERLEAKGFKFAPIDIASRFGQARNNKHYYSKPFGFHRGFIPEES